MYQTMQYGTCSKINANKAWENKSAYQALFAEETSLITLIKLPNCRRYMYLFHWSSIKITLKLNSADQNQ